MSENKEKDSEVLLEKVRELEASKPDKNIEDKENTARILNEKRDLSAPLSDDEAKKLMGTDKSRFSFKIRACVFFIFNVFIRLRCFKFTNLLQ